MRGTVVAVLLLATAWAKPQVYFPINAQVPPVARVSQPFEYQFSSRTCVSTSGASLTYTLQDAPTWLSLSSTRTITGSPGANNVGPVNIKLVATDTTGSLSMPFILIVVDDTAPTVSGNITEQLSQAGTLADSNSLELSSGQSFSFAFSLDTFSNASSALYYYATSADRSPLPGWLIFESDTITFSGTVPVISTPQEFGVLLSASTIAGFSETSIEFNLVISAHVLAFVPLEQVVQINDTSTPLNVSIMPQLQLDGKPVSAQQIATISANTPSSLKFDATALALTGLLPADESDVVVTFNATDTYGDTASGSVRLVRKSAIFSESIGTLSAVIGQDFTYKIPTTLFKDSSISVLKLAFGSGAPWLQYDASTMTIHGKVPAAASISSISASISATSGTTTESQSFTIRVVSASATRETTSSTSQSSTSRPSTGSVPSDTRHNHAGLSQGAIAAAVIFPTLIVLALLIALLYCMKKRPYYVSSQQGCGKRYSQQGTGVRQQGGPFAALGFGALRKKDNQHDPEKHDNSHQDDLSQDSYSSQTLPEHDNQETLGGHEYSDDSTLGAHEERVLASIDRTSLGPSAGHNVRRAPYESAVLPLSVVHSTDTSPNRTSAKRKSRFSTQESPQRPMKRLSINRFSRDETARSTHSSPCKMFLRNQSSRGLVYKPGHQAQESVSAVAHSSRPHSGMDTYRVSALTASTYPYRSNQRLTSEDARKSIRLVPVDERFPERRQDYFKHRRRTTSSQHTPWFTGSVDNRESVASQRRTLYSSRRGRPGTRGRNSVQSIRSIQSRSSDARAPSSRMFAESSMQERANDIWEDSDGSDDLGREEEDVVEIVPDSVRQSRRAKWSKRLQRDISGHPDSSRMASMQSRMSFASSRPSSQRKHSILSIVMNDSSWYNKLSVDERRRKGQQDEDASSGIVAFI